MTDPAEEAARAAAVILAPDLGPDLPAQVEAALHLRNRGESRPTQYDPLAIVGLGTGAASLIVSIAQLAWAIYSDRRKRSPELSADSIALQVRMTFREQGAALPPGSELMTNVIVTEIIRISGDSSQSGLRRSPNLRAYRLDPSPPVPRLTSLVEGDPGFLEGLADACLHDAFALLQVARRRSARVP